MKYNLYIFNKKVYFLITGFLAFLFAIGSVISVRAEAERQAADPLVCMTWDLVHDFRMEPDQENPSRDSCNNPDVWQYLGSSDLTRDPLNYSLLSPFDANSANIPGLNIWGSNSAPYAAYNASGGTILGKWSVETFHVHPDVTQFSVTAWRSPMSGYISITGTLRDDDAGGGDGIEWFIDKNTANLAYGSYDDGGLQAFSDGINGESLNMVWVDIGDMLYFVVGPRANYLYDSTQVEVVINVVSDPANSTITPIPSYMPIPSETFTALITSTVTQTDMPTETLTPMDIFTFTPTITSTPTIIDTLVVEDMTPTE